METDPKTLEANIRSLQLEWEALRRIMDGMIKEGDHQLHTWLENVSSSEQHYSEIEKEVGEIKSGLRANIWDERLKLSNKVTECLNVVKALKQSAVELFLCSAVGAKLKRFSLDDIKGFTSNLSKEIGAGGFAVVYKGKFPDNVQIAVKVLKQNHVTEEIFMIEVGTLLKATHPNLIKLYGFCFDGNMKALVYEFMRNGSLDVVLLQKPRLVEWKTLYAMAVEIAKALAYLHHKCGDRIIHHDIKPSNVLLDATFCPRVADFGTARIMSSDVSHFIMTSMRGTCGYTAPEMVMQASRVTYKCDVYSFGNILFDILGFNIDQQEEVWYKLEKGGLDESLKECGIMKKDAKRARILSLVAYWCIQFSADIRPSMNDVVSVLEEKMQVGRPPNPFYSWKGNHAIQQPEDVISSTDSPSTDGSGSTGERLRDFLKERGNVVPDSFKSSFNGLAGEKHRRFSHANIISFTSGFSEKIYTLFGGDVYIGRLPSGVQVAVNILEENTHEEERFIFEVTRIMGMSHRHLVKLIGFCFERNMKAHVFEYMPNGPLDRILFDNHHGDVNWNDLYNIVLQTAKGLLYLHDGCDAQIVHGDVKASNVLLDSNFSAKLAIYRVQGLIRGNTGGITLSQFNEDMSNVAPEVMCGRRITPKSDVYSFGMMMIEVLVRQRNLRGKVYFPRILYSKVEEQRFDEITKDCGLREYDREKVMIFCMVAFWCTQYLPRSRPSMDTVIKMLQKEMQVMRPPCPFNPSHTFQSFRDVIYD